MPDLKEFSAAIGGEGPQQEAVMGVWWVGQMLKKNARRFFSGVLASEMQFNILALLKYADHPLSQQEISDRLFVDKSNLTGVAGRMEGAGLIARRVDPRDARAYQLFLTPAGRGVLDKVEDPYRERIHDLMSSFSEDELTRLIDYLGRIEAAIEQKTAGEADVRA